MRLHVSSSKATASAAGAHVFIAPDPIYAIYPNTQQERVLCVPEQTTIVQVRTMELTADNVWVSAYAPLEIRY